MIVTENVITSIIILQSNKWLREKIRERERERERE